MSGSSGQLFDLLAPVLFNIVLLALRRRDLTEKLVAAVRDTGRTFVTPTVLHGRAAIRATFSSWRTTERDMDIIWEALVAAANGCAGSSHNPADNGPGRQATHSRTVSSRRRRCSDASDERECGATSHRDKRLLCW